MISETQMAYGSRVCRQGRSRPFRRYQSSRRRLNHRLAVGSGSVSFVYASIKNLTAVETLVFAPGSRTVARAHCHYRAPAG